MKSKCEVVSRFVTLQQKCYSKLHRTHKKSTGIDTMKMPRYLLCSILQTPPPQQKNSLTPTHTLRPELAECQG